MLSFVVYLTACAVLAQAQEEEMMEFDNKTECINRMVEWCDGMQYPQQGVGLALMSVTFEDPKGYYRIFCSSDSEGTNCTRNGVSWFTCSPEHVMTYKGRIMTNTSTDVDNDICATASTAFNDLFVQNLSYDNTTMKNEVTKGFEAFFEQIAAMEEQIELIQKMLRYIPALNSLWSEYDDSFLFENSDSITSVAGSSDSTTSVSDGDLQRSDDSSTSVPGSLQETDESSTSAPGSLQETDDSATSAPGSLQETDDSTTSAPGNLKETDDSATSAPGSLQETYDSTTSALGNLKETDDSTAFVLGSLQSSDSTTSVPDDSLQRSDDSTNSVPVSLQSSDTTTTVPVDNQNSTQQQKK